MADNSKKRTNWTDTQKRVTGVVTTVVVVLLILLCVSVFGKKPAASVAVTPAPAPVATAPVTTTPAKTEAAPAPAPAKTEPAPAPAKTEPAPAAPVVAEPVKVEEPAKAEPTPVETTPVAEPVKAEEPAPVETVVAAEPEKAEAVAEVVVEVAPVAEPVVEVATVAKEKTVEEAPVAEEATSSNYSFDIYSYGVKGAYSDGFFCSETEAEGLVSAEDIMGFVAYENNKYSFLKDNVVIHLVDNGFQLDIPSGINAGDYVDQFQADLYEYVNQLLAPKAEAPVVEAPVVVVEETAPVVEEAPVAEAPVVEMESAIIEERLFTSFSFEVFGYPVYGEIDGESFQTAVISNLVAAEDVEGFCQYEVTKYPFLAEVPCALYKDGFALMVPAEIDARDYIDAYQTEIYAYVCQLLNIEKPADVKTATVQDTPYGIYAFDIYGHDIEGAYTADAFSSITDEVGIVSAEDIENFVSYEVAKYPFLYESVSIEIIPDGFLLDLRVPVDARDYIDLYKAEILEYINQLLAPKAEVVAPVVEETPVVEEEKVNTYSFSVFGYGVQGAYADGCFTSESVTKGLLAAEDIMGFVAYENGKYSFLKDNVVIALQEDGFVLTIPTGIDAGAYLDQYQADIIEYVNQLLAPKAEAPVEEAPVAEVPAPVVETAPVAEATAPVAEEPAPATEAVVPTKIESVEVVVVTDGSEKVAPASPAAEKVKYNNFKVEVSLKGGAYAEAQDELRKYALMGGISVDFKNALDFGTRVGFGARLNGNATIRPTTGWKGALDNFNIRNFNSEIAASADLMFYANFNKATMYAGAGAGYCVTRNIDPIVSDTLDIAGFQLKSGLFIEGTAGMSIELAKHFAMGLDLGYRYYPSTEKTSVNGGLTLTYIF